MVTEREAGTSIFNASLVIAKTAKEIEAMMEELQDTLQSSLGEEGLVKLNVGIKLSDEEEAYRNDPMNWLCQAYLYQYKLIKNGRSPFGYLGIQVCLGDEDLHAVGIDEAVVHVMFAESEWGVDQFGLPPMAMVDTCGSTLHVHLEADKLWRLIWESEESDPETAWVFSVPLAGLNTVDDLKNQIVHPVAALLKDTPVDQALSKGDKIMRFSGDAESCRRIIAE